MTHHSDPPPHHVDEAASSRRARWITFLVFVIFPVTSFAQRASENAVTEAADAFGVKIGREVVGLYSASSARGFSPTTAGNLRVSGLYFDQASQANLSNRIVRSSSVHVGLGAQNYAFPAPTGVVDFQLRTPGPQASLSALLGYASYDQFYAELDAQAPIIDDVLNLGGGIGYSRNAGFPYADESEEWSVGAVAHWQPTASLSVTPFWGKTRNLERGEKPLVFLGTSGFPRFRMVDMPYVPWADWSADSTTYGSTLHLDAADNWDLEVGLFRSERYFPYNVQIFLSDVDSTGAGAFSVEASPSRTSRSVSGEALLRHRIVTDSTRQTWGFSLKARDSQAESGGSDRRNAGFGSVVRIPEIPMPDFQTKGITEIEASELTPGISYEVMWRSGARVGLGIQKVSYRRILNDSNGESNKGVAAPWLYNLGASKELTSRVVLYASVTRGFETAGTAPANAVNRGEPAPAQLTTQIDGGFKYALSDELSLVAGVFSIEKPYYSLDQSNFYRNVGSTSNKGLELSLSGAITENLTLVAGYTYIDPVVEYEESGNETTRAKAVGPIPGLLRANLQYRVANYPGLVLETKFEYSSQRYARYKAIKLPSYELLDLGVRYSSQVRNMPATYRAQFRNIFNRYGLLPEASGRISAVDGRRFELSLALDITPSSSAH